MMEFRERGGALQLVRTTTGPDGRPRHEVVGRVPVTETVLPAEIAEAMTPEERDAFARHAAFRGRATLQIARADAYRLADTARAVAEFVGEAEVDADELAFVDQQVRNAQLHLARAARVLAERAKAGGGG